MAFDKIVGVDGTTYNLPDAVRTKLSSNITTSGQAENTAVAAVVAAGITGKANTVHTHTVSQITDLTSIGSIPGVEIGVVGPNGITLADKHTLQYESSTSKWRNKVASGGVTVSATPPATPILGDAWFDSNDGTLYVYYSDGTSIQWVQVQANSALEGTILSRLGAVESDVANINTSGYRYVSSVTYTSSGTFTKATYPWLRAIRVRVQAAGGGGGGAPSIPTGQVACGKAGAGGVYAEKFITDIAGLASSVTVTVGAGGAGGAAGNNAGGTGGDSSFGSLASAAGGTLGGTIDYTYPPNLPGVSVPGPTNGVGDLVIPGGDSTSAVAPSVSFVRGGDGGDSFMSTAQAGVTVVASGSNGRPGKLYGGGGTAGANAENQATARSGGAGANGIVIVELYA